MRTKTSSLPFSFAPLLPSGPECLCLFPANVSQICWHGNLGVSTGRQSARALATREATDSPRLPTMPFAYGRCHQGAGLCQLRVTCPLQLLYVIIEPICSAQQGLNGNHEAAIGKMEGKCEEGMGWKGKGGEKGWWFESERQASIHYAVWVEDRGNLIAVVKCIF